MKRYRSALTVTLTSLALPLATAAAQEMKIPGEVQIESNIVKPTPLEATSDNIASLKMPAGFKIEKWAEDLKGPRVIVSAPGGVYISSREAGTITFISVGEDGRAGARKTVLEKENVHGMAVQNGRLFYITVKEVFSAPIEKDGSLGDETKVLKDLPDAGQHPNRTIGFGPDGWLYISVGSTCNECDEKNPQNATMLRVHSNGTGMETFATGLRNTIGFDWQPGTASLYGMDDGVDWLGNEDQREELNKIEQGKQYGWPYVFGDGLKNYYRETKVGTLDDWDRQSVRPVQTWTAHASSMQFIFNKSNAFPPEYASDAFATMHGSWNRKPPSGYEVVRIHFENGTPKSITPFLTGFLKMENGTYARFARPFGLAQLSDGSLLIGEDQNGVIYRMSYAR